MTALSGWENFYTITGSSAGARIGLQFVVLTLIANRPLSRATAQAGDTFSTALTSQQRGRRGMGVTFQGLGSHFLSEVIANSLFVLRQSLTFHGFQ